LATVVATRGSTPQKVGAKLLIRADGQSSIGTLGGGCVEGQVWQEAIRALAAGRPSFASYELSDDYAGDNGMICGGTMEIMVDVWTSADLALAHRAADALAAGRPCVLTTVIEGEAIGDKLLLASDNSASSILNCDLGDVKSGDDQLAIGIQSAVDGGALGLREAAVLGLPKYNATIFCESLRGQAELLIVGAGHVAQALCQVASFAGFAVTVLDNRARFANHERFPTAVRVLAAEIEPTLPSLTIGPQTYIVIVTRGHQFDEGALRLVVDAPAAYIGMIGSRRKVLLVYKRMIADGYDIAKLRPIYAPLGLAIGAETVEEIAVSIVAELIKVRRQGGEGAARHMRDELKIKDERLKIKDADVARSPGRDQYPSQPRGRQLPPAECPYQAKRAARRGYLPRRSGYCRASRRG
jgi:xanthine dehydrogenase accessory factor